MDRRLDEAWQERNRARRDAEQARLALALGGGGVALALALGGGGVDPDGYYGGTPGDWARRLLHLKEKAQQWRAIASDLSWEDEDAWGRELAAREGGLILAIDALDTSRATVIDSSGDQPQS